MRNISGSQYDATRTSDTEVLHFRDKVESDGGRGDEWPDRPSDLRAPNKTEVNATGRSETRKKGGGVRGWATCGDRGSSWFDQEIGRGVW